MLEQGFVEINSPKIVMKEAFSYRLIRNDEIWIQILNDSFLSALDGGVPAEKLIEIQQSLAEMI